MNVLIISFRASLPLKKKYFRALTVILEIGVHLNVVNLSLICFIWKERNAKILEDKGWLDWTFGISLLFT